MVVNSNLDKKTISAKDAVQLALNHYNKGNLKQAERILREVLSKQPKNDVALQLLSVTLYSAGDTAKAIKYLEQAIDINPYNADYRANISEMLRNDKKLDSALNHANKAIELKPNSTSAISNLALIYFDKDDLKKAEELQLKALQIDPKLVSALNNLGSIYKQYKDLENAKKHYQKAIDINPNHIDSINNLGVVLNELKKPEEAVNIFAKAIKIKPNFAESHCNIGNSFLILENFDKAILAFNNANKFRQNYIEAYIGLAKAYKETNKLTEAMQACENALKIDENKADIYCAMGDIQVAESYPDKAEKSFDKAIELNPESHTAYLHKGHLYMEMGKIKEAEDNFNKALELKPEDIGAKIAMVQVKKITEDDKNFKALLKEAEKLKEMRDFEAIPINFALGKCFDDTKQYDLAFKHYAEGCRLKRKTLNFSAENNNLVAENICKFFTPEKIASLKGNGCESDLPIFVLGMPRSGTTLTEQIIASHPLVHGAGELPDLMKLACEPKGLQTEGYPLSIQEISKQDLKIIGENYVAGLRKRNSKASFITDKMPANFNALGFIHLILPNAKIIHVKRNPVDTCLSCFTKLFNKSQFHSYDLFEIGNYYRNYEIIMNHWKKVLPAGSFYEVQYEDLVADTENQARKLIDYCKLEWNDACLNFHKTERSIKTASVTQVRQPIYKTSVERWRKYENHLKPLLDVLSYGK